MNYYKNKAINFNFLFLFLFTVFFEPTDLVFAGKPFNLPKQLIKQIKFISPNIKEFLTITKALNFNSLINNNKIIDDKLIINAIKSYHNNNNNEFMEIRKDLKLALEYVNSLIDNIILTLGPIGVLIVRNNSNTELLYHSPKYYEQQFNVSTIKETFTPTTKIRYYPTNEIQNIVNVTGAGDNFTCGFICGMLRFYPENICVSIGFEAAAAALQCHGAVPDKYFDKNHNCWSEGKPFIEIFK